MGIFQPSINPPPEGLDLSGKTAIITGASAGIGLEISSYFVEHKISTLILAVRNTLKGEKVRTALLEKSAGQGQSSSHNVDIKVLKLDLEDYSSVKGFLLEIGNTTSELHILMLNAGISNPRREFLQSGHEKSVQVNFLSNAVITLALRPLLESTAAKTGCPSRITWSGTRMYAMTSLDNKAPLEKGETILAHFDKSSRPPNLLAYPDSKFLCYIFIREFAKHYSSQSIIVNSFCPGFVSTNLNDGFPLWLRAPVNLYSAISARKSEVAGWIAVNAAVVAGPETHGKLLEDKDIKEPSPFVLSPEGQRLQKLLWEETIQEVQSVLGNVIL